jgi:hypothetical protein
MSIEIETTITLAEVEVTDDYSVELRQRRRKVSYAPQEAMRLGAELTTAAMDAQDKLAADLGHETVAHEFDLAPICTDCREGKHTACIGSASVENGPEKNETDCGCNVAGHPKVGSAT